MKTKQEFNKVSQIVEKLLKENVRCRSDDKYLIFLTMSHFTKFYIPFEDFKKIPAFETISRVRRMIQKDKPYLKADKQTQLLRIERQQQIKEIVR